MVFIMTFTANQVTVTPEIAAQWLATSPGNRNIRRRKVEEFKADMLQGKWRYNGDRVRFTQDGKLYDAHHRLTACVESGVTITVDTFVISDDAKATVDKGTARTTGDNLTMDRGISPQKAASIAAAIRMMIAHDQTSLTDWARPVGGSYASNLLAEQSLQDYYEKNIEKINQAADWAEENIKKQNTVISRSQAVSFLCLGSRAYPEVSCYEYLHTVVTGYGIEMGSTQDHIRSALVAVKMMQRKMKTQHKLYSVIKGFKSVMAGRQIKHACNAPFRPSADTPPRFEVKQ